MSVDISSLSGSIGLNASLVAAIAGTLATATDNLNYQNKLSATYGTGSNQVNQLLHTRINIPAASPVVPGLFDLQATVNAFGHTAVLTKVKAILIVNSSTTAATILVGQNSGTWNGFNALFSANTITVNPGDCIYLTARDGGMVVDGTHKTIGYQSGSTTLAAILDIIVVGVE